MQASNFMQYINKIQQMPTAQQLAQFKQQFASQPNFSPQQLAQQIAQKNGISPQQLNQIAKQLGITQ
jgi:hypothetical protein